MQRNCDGMWKRTSHALMKALLLASLSIVSPLLVRAGDADPKSEPLLQGIRATLPKGWTAKYEKDTSCLTVERDEPVSGGLGLPNMPAPPMERVSQMYVMGPMQRYSFSFRVMDFVTPAQYQRWVGENAEVEKKARVIYDDFEKRRLLGKGGRLEPRTDGDKAAAARHKELTASKHALPDFYFKKLSVRWVWGAPAAENNGWVSFYVDDDRIRGECDQVREKVLKLFSNYQDP